MNQKTTRSTLEEKPEEKLGAEVEPGTFPSLTILDGRQIEYTAGSGNVFADLERPDAAEMQFKSNLVFCIRQLM